MYAFPYLSRVIGAEMFARLLAMMPPPLDPSPEAKQDRDVVAMCMLKQMGPIKTAEEASLAVTVVAADAHAHDALRGAAENAGDLKVVMQCRAQANTMMRTRHKAAAALDALIRSRMAAQRLADERDAEEKAADTLAVAQPAAAQPDMVAAEGEEPPVDAMAEAVIPKVAPAVAPVMPVCVAPTPRVSNGAVGVVSMAAPVPPPVPAIVQPSSLAHAA